jgi:2-dehydro-3-deoxyphosphogluconate aldolase/(4S)-4-hydroxy-2-oxoglutarate aldolase
MERLCKGRVIATLAGVKAERLVPMAEALLAGSIDCVQIAYDPRGDQSDRDVAAQIKMLADHFGSELCLGAGSVRKPEQVRMAHEAGARFIASCAADQTIIRMTRDFEMVSMPGAFTPAEIDTAYHMGGDLIRLFPASFLGTEYLEQLAQPLSHVPLVACGGISVWNMRAFLDAGCAAVELDNGLMDEVYKPECDFGVLAETAKAYRTITDNERAPRNRNLR